MNLSSPKFITDLAYHWIVSSTLITATETTVTKNKMQNSLLIVVDYFCNLLVKNFCLCEDASCLFPSYRIHTHKDSNSW
jgi:hypothetical protein